MDQNHVNPYDNGTATAFPDKAKKLVVEYYNKDVDKAWSDLDRVILDEIEIGDVFVVWFAKILQNWKAIVATTVEDGRIYEVTYNGEKNEYYLDMYEKKDNVKLLETESPV